MNNPFLSVNRNLANLQSEIQRINSINSNMWLNSLATTHVQTIHSPKVELSDSDYNLINKHKLITLV